MLAILDAPWRVVGMCIQACVNLVHTLQKFVIGIYVLAVSYMP